VKWPFLFLALLLTLVSSAPAADQPPQPLLTGLKSPASVAVGSDGRVYLTVAGEPGKDGSGAVLVVNGNKAAPFATGLEDPRGLAVYLEWLFVADKQRVWRIDRTGKAEVFVAASAFRTPPQSLQDIVADPESGTLYVSDAGDALGKGGAVFSISPKGQVDLITDATRLPALHTPGALLLDCATHLLLADSGTGDLHRIKLFDRSVEKVGGGLGAASGLARDTFGRVFAGDGKGGRVLAIPRPNEKPVPLATGFEGISDLCIDPSGKRVLVADRRAGTLTALPTQVPGAEVDDKPLPLETAVAFPNLQWSGWKGEDERGQPNPLRPLVLTHAGDGSNRVFVATQQGVLHVFPNDQKATTTRVFLDIRERVRYNDKENEEGLLGLAFHPDYKKTGEFFLFYTDKKAKLQNVISRFRVSKTDPDVADPASEEELIRFSHKYWNHDGGTICFGPDGYLYIAVGDGGLANDPDENGQNLGTHLAKVLRIDVNHKDEGKKYAIPKDNPFVDKVGAKPEIYAYGVRNPWRMAFDRKTGQFWLADVGQNLFEEIDLVVKGGNYGWNVREGLHPFGAKGVGVRPDVIDPIWEYYHDIGKSITGGPVYRGERLPELEGHYLYADYVSGRIWALKYGEKEKRVVANRPIKDRSLPIMSFGEDERGEAYLLTYSATGRGVYWFVMSGGNSADKEK
jgi:glucose/arabinose dehydrogenase